MLYVRDIDLIHQFHSVININDYCLRLENWEELMVLSFTMNKQNYARYGTYILTSRELGGTNGVKFYNEQAELCTVWYIQSNTDGVT